jgi:hypothetical protein
MQRCWRWLEFKAYTPLFEYLSDCSWCAGDIKRSLLWMVLNAMPTVVCLTFIRSRGRQTAALFEKRRASLI